MRADNGGASHHVDEFGDAHLVEPAHLSSDAIDRVGHDAQHETALLQACQRLSAAGNCLDLVRVGIDLGDQCPSLYRGSDAEHQKCLIPILAGAEAPPVCLGAQSLLARLVFCREFHGQAHSLEKAGYIFSRWLGPVIEYAGGIEQDTSNCHGSSPCPR